MMRLHFILAAVLVTAIAMLSACKVDTKRSSDISTLKNNLYGKWKLVRVTCGGQDSSQFPTDQLLSGVPFIQNFFVSDKGATSVFSYPITSPEQEQCIEKIPYALTIRTTADLNKSNIMNLVEGQTTCSGLCDMYAYDCDTTPIAEDARINLSFTVSGNTLVLTDRIDDDYDPITDAHDTCVNGGQQGPIVWEFARQADSGF
jgi:hypothetical protein